MAKWTLFLSKCPVFEASGALTPIRRPETRADLFNLSS